MALLLHGCCTSDQCLDKMSGPDRDRMGAPRINPDLVYNDSVSSDRRDRTDWKYVMLTRPGKLTALLHWDNGKAKLELDVFDVMGIRVQEGRVWGLGGLRAVVAVEEPGPYYIRVRAATKDDESQYALRLVFNAETGGKQVCHNCKEGDRKCLGTTSYIICEKLGPGCTAWTKNFACPAEVACKNGMCDACSSPCTEGLQRCATANTYQICIKEAGAQCPAWGPARSCGAKQRCHGDRCVKRGHIVKKDDPVVRPPVEPPKSAVTKGRIISLYRYRGVPTLHIEIGENPAIRPGQTGSVLDGETNKPLPGGEIKITKVSGRFAIATTSLQQVGKNRWVRIDAK
jgi:hypothetical protein